MFPVRPAPLPLLYPCLTADTRTQAYTIAWAFDFVVPLLASTMVLLIAFPPARAFLFPPAPLALVSAKHGGIQKPLSGTLGSDDSVTGAPEHHKGEAVEKEASNFVDGVASIAVSSVAGKHPQGDPHPPASESETGGGGGDGGGGVGQLAGSVVPDPSSVVKSASAAKGKSAGAKPHASHDKTKQPMEAAMWNKMRPVMHGISDVSDTWERFGK
jgi:hypothetical protein